MDVRMAGIGGIEAIRRLRAAGRSTVIVAFTASGLDAMMAEARAAGANEVLLTPYKEAELLHRIADLPRLRYEYADDPISPAPPASLRKRPGRRRSRVCSRASRTSWSSSCA